MTQKSTIFLQTVIVLLAIVVLIMMLRFPLSEGRAKNLDLFHIYFDPFILYGYATSVAFFVGLYKAFRLLGYIRQNKIFSLKLVRTLRSIKYCALILSILIVAAGLYVRIFHHKEDDPAGFLALCMITTFCSIIVAVAAVVFENVLQAGMDLKSKNEHLTNPPHDSPPHR